jgi:hypothetical protein
MRLADTNMADRSYNRFLPVYVERPNTIPILEPHPHLDRIVPLRPRAHAPILRGEG